MQNGRGARRPGNGVHAVVAWLAVCAVAPAAAQERAEAAQEQSPAAQPAAIEERGAAPPERAATAGPGPAGAAPFAPAAVPPPVQLGKEILVGEIVLKGRRPTRTDSLEAREVRERGARDLGEALASSPSIDKVRKGGIANDIVLRGMKKDDVAVTVDGAKVHGACPSRMDPPSFHLDYAEVDAVLVKRGPFDVSQTGSLGGAIDVRTRRAHDGPGVELNLEGGSAALMSGSLTGSYGTERWDVLVGGALKQGRPYLMGDGRNFTEIIPQYLGTASGVRYASTSDDRDAYRIGSGFGRVGLVPVDGQRLELGYAHQSAPLALYPYLKMDGVADDTDRVTARWSADRLGPVAATVSAYWNRVSHDMTDELRCSRAGALNAAACGSVLPRGWSMGTEARSRTWGGQAEVRGGDAVALVAWKAGADLYVRTWDNATTRWNQATTSYATVAQIPDVRIQGAGLYGEAYRSLGAAGARTRLTAGVRVDLARTEARIDRRSVYGLYYPAADNALSHDDALVGGNLQLERELGAGVAAWVGYGHGTRVADPQERYMALEAQGTKAMPDWLGQPRIAPVQSDEVDVGATWKARGVLVKAQAYHAWYASYITLVEAWNGTRWARTYDNVSARMFGGEITGRVALPWSLFAGVGASYTRGLNETAGTSLAEIPPFKASASVRWDDGRFFAEVEELYAAAQSKVDPRLLESPTPAWWTTSLKAGTSWKGMKVFASVNNLFDRQYVEHLSYQRDPFASGVKVPEPGRFFQLAAQYAF